MVELTFDLPPGSALVQRNEKFPIEEVHIWLQGCLHVHCKVDTLMVEFLPVNKNLQNVEPQNFVGIILTVWRFFRQLI